ncbi:MAG TPA: rod shape-determining protein MreC [Kiritimatiellia bacterium]|nr:rod shape-determining protein MreC [Kiritimatiellia bacterium]HMO98105.1 rod shape-determining protein MreC [Kiritimatiellia bacterium]HMP96315.1 rod shape-determining protein MreC [Kiritimatiellia bacterium]
MNDRLLIRWLVLGVVVIALLNLPDAMTGAVKAAFRETARPLQRAVDSVFGTGWDYMKSIGRIPGLMGENKTLRLEVERLTAERNSLRLLEYENAELRRQLGFQPPPETTWIACRVLARSRDGWWQTIRLNKGASDGVEENMAVVSLEGLVGRTVAVSRNTSDVLLVSDPAFRVSSRLLRTGSFGVVSGRGPSWQGQVFCRMEFIHKNDVIHPGDDVVTSGLGGVFPPNIPIGYVDRVVTDPSGLYQHADIITRADLSSLQFVFVLNVRDPSAAGAGRP